MFTAMRDLYMRNGQGFFLVYAINSHTFNEIPEIHEQILRVKDAQSVPAVLLGSKCDLVNERTITTEKGQEMAKRLGVSFFETSALTRHNIDAAFADLVRQMRKNIAAKETLSDKGKRSKNSNCSVL
jgi:GTPase KRas